MIVRAMRAQAGNWIIHPGLFIPRKHSRGEGRRPRMALQVIDFWRDDETDDAWRTNHTYANGHRGDMSVHTLKRHYIRMRGEPRP